MNKNNIIFPFVAVLGQESIKKVIIWNIVNPNIGGVLISGEKGTAKSTLVRGATCIAPHLKLVDLPLNVTEDRLMGNINFEHAIKYGKKRFEAGILQKAHGNILYVDEVNLLSDHIVKTLLESSASGINIVEREGISYRHPSKFILIGSMNPEEGRLRAQFLDRFGLYVEVEGEKDIRSRTEIIRRRIEFEKNPKSFFEKWQGENEKISLEIKRARSIIDDVEATTSAMELAASIAKEGKCSGHRGELVIIETAKAIAALDSRKTINLADIKEAAKYALPHRVRDDENPLDPPPIDEDESNDSSEEEEKDEGDKNQEEEEKEPQVDQDEIPNESEQDNDTGKLPDQKDKSEESNDKEVPKEKSETVDTPGDPFIVSRWLLDKREKIRSKGSGRRSLVKTSTAQGRYVKYRYPIKGEITDIAIDATLRAAASNQLHREKIGRAVAIEKSDIRVKVREKRTGNTIIFVVDASGSMGANKRMKAVKGAILSLLNDAYQKRDRVAMIAFKNRSAELLLGITRSVELAQKQLSILPTGGRTPLAAGLDMAYEIVKSSKIKDKDMLPVIVLISDGRATFSNSGIDPLDDALQSAQKIANEKIKTIVIDTDQNFIKMDYIEKLSKAVNGDVYKIDDLKAQSIVAAVNHSL